MSKRVSRIVIRVFFIQPDLLKSFLISQLYQIPVLEVVKSVSAPKMAFRVVMKVCHSCQGQILHGDGLGVMEGFPRAPFPQLMPGVLGLPSLPFFLLFPVERCVGYVVWLTSHHILLRIHACQQFYDTSNEMYSIYILF